MWPWLLLLLLALLWSIRVYNRSTVCELPQRIDGQLVIVTGCNCGIGLETVYELVKRGARVIMACRDMSRCKRAREELLRRSCSDDWAMDPQQLICEQLDLSSFESIRAFAGRILSRHPRIYALVNNAGVSQAGAAPVHDRLERGRVHEVHMRVNHLGHFCLTQLLLPSLQRQFLDESTRGSLVTTNTSRIINVSSDSHYLATLNVHDLNRPLQGSCYAHSKLANVIHAQELTRRYARDGIVAVSLHPGLVVTDLYRQPTIVNLFIRYALAPLVKTSWHGAQTTIHCVLEPNLVPGAYYRDCAPCLRPNAQVADDRVASLLWQISEEAVRTPARPIKSTAARAPSLGQGGT